MRVKLERKSMMEEKRNAYEIIGTSREAVYMRKTDQDRDVFVKEKKDDAIKIIERKICALEERIQLSDKCEQEKRKYELERALIEQAYLEIANAAKRKQYDVALEVEMINIKQSIEEKNRIEDAYKILCTTSKKCQDNLGKSPDKVDAFLLERRDGLLRNATYQITSLRSRISLFEKNDSTRAFREKSRLLGEIARIEVHIQKVKDAYEKVKDKKARKIYNIELAKKEEQEKERIKQNYLKREYMCKPNIDSIVQVGHKFLEGGMVTVTREDGTEVTIERIGMVAYRTLGNITAGIDEYRIRREIDGKKKWDVRYANLNMGELQNNKEYHDFVANIFLSEDSLEGAKYNKGYLGRVLKDKNEDYIHDLTDINELSAIAKLKEKEEKDKPLEKIDIKGESHEQ